MTAIALLALDAVIFGGSIWRLCRERDDSGALLATAILSGMPLLLVVGSVSFVMAFGVLR